VSNETLWALLAILLVLDGLIAVTRASLLLARQPYLLTLEEHDPDTVGRTQRLLENPRLRSTLRLAAFLVHSLLAVVVWNLFAVLTGWSLNLALLLVGVTLVVLLVSSLEFFLEGRILVQTEAWAVRLTWFGRLLVFFFRPLVALLTLLMGPPEVLQYRLSPVTEDELKDWVEAGPAEGDLEKGERKMIYSIFQFGDTLCREIMVPRMDIFSLDANTSLAEAVRGLSESGHSRVPIYEETIDNIVGILYAKDLLHVWYEGEAQTNVRRFLRPAYFVPEAKKVDDLLSEMQARRVHLAVVVDEYGGVAGLVTMEDIVEEIIGEIRDEYDQSEELLYQAVGTEEYIFQGRIDLEDFNELTGTHLTREVADTLGGWIYGQIGRVPTGGEQVRAEDWLLTVELVAGRRIRKVRALRQPLLEREEEDEDGVE